MSEYLLKRCEEMYPSEKNFDRVIQSNTIYSETDIDVLYDTLKEMYPSINYDKSLLTIGIDVYIPRIIESKIRIHESLKFNVNDSYAINDDICDIKVHE